MNRADRSRGGADLHQPAHGRDPCDGRGDPEQAEERVQPSLAGAAATGLDVQDVRARGCGRDGDQPRLDVLRLRPVHLQGPPGRELRRRQLVVRPHVRQRLLRMELDPQRDDPFGQRGVRAAHPGRHPGARRRDRAAHGSPLAARRQRRIRAGDRARLRRRLAARHRVRLRDARRRRRLRGADGDPARRARRTVARTRTRAGASRSDAARSRRERLRSSPASSSRTSSPEPVRGRLSGDRRPARPGRTRSTRTRGSPATRRISRRRSGSATRKARSRWRTSTASP